MSRGKSVRCTGTLAVVLAAALVCMTAGYSAAAVNARLGVYFDDQGTQCHGTIRPGSPATIYILAKVGADTPGITGAEFRFEGLPSSWVVFPVANSTAFNVGDPFANGVNIAFSECMGPSGAVVPLYRVLVLATSDEEDVQFTLVQKNLPSNPNFPCPLVTACDPPMFTMHCVTSEPCQVNATSPGPCDEITAVEAATWSAVRGLYR